MAEMTIRGIGMTCAHKDCVQYLASLERNADILL